jgi:hypothetical protein
MVVDVRGAFLTMVMGIQDLHSRLCGVAGFKSTSYKVHILFFQGIYYRSLVGLFVGSENPNF